MASPRPPKSVERILGWLIHPDLLEEILGDLHEYHDEIAHHHPFRRKLFFWFHVFHFLRPSLLKKFNFPYSNSFAMTSLLLKLSFRQIRKKQLITSISLITLIVGVLSFQLTYSWIRNERSMDEFHTNKNRIALGVARFVPEGNLLAPHISRLFQIDYSSYPEVEKSMLVHTYMPGEMKLKAGDIQYDAKGLVADSIFLEFFDFKMVSGSRDILNDPSSILITEDFAKRTFKDQDPVGQIVHISCDQEATYKVAGILEKVPSSSSIDFDFVAPRHSRPFWRRVPQDFIMIREGASLSELNEKIRTLGVESERFSNSEVYFYPFRNIYKDHPVNIPFFSRYGDENNLGSVQLIAFALLLVTIICYTNLQTSVQLAEIDRMKLKHLIGAGRKHLVLEWIIRGIVYFTVAFFISAIIYLTLFETIVEYIELDVDSQPVKDLIIIGTTILGCVILSTLIAFYNVLKSIKDLNVTSENSIQAIGQPRKILAIAQYAITILLLICSIIASLQLKYMLNKDLGISQSEILSTRFFDIIPSVRQDSIKREKMLGQYRYILNRLDEDPNIVARSQGDQPLGFAYDLPFQLSSSSEEFTPVKTLNVDPGFDEVFDLEVIEGRFFNETDRVNDGKVLINESARKYFRIDNINDAKLTMELDNRDHQVIGVVKDFHFEHLSQSIKPLILPFFHHPDDDIIIKHVQGKEQEVLGTLEGLFSEINPDGIFNASFFSSKVDLQYAKEKKVRRIYSVFGFIAIILSSVTLFSFVYHEANRRTKEVGIRKVSGASSVNIFRLFSISFIKSIAISIMISFPIGWYIMDLWLENFANRVNQGIWIYFVITILVLAWALLAVLWHSIKLSRLNPIESLRYE